MVYLDCNATTPLEPKVEQIMVQYMSTDFGNAGSRTHEYGLRAKQACFARRPYSWVLEPALPKSVDMY